MDPDPSIFNIDFQDANKKLILKKVFLQSTVLFEGTFTSLFRDKSQKEVTKQKNQCFSYYFCLMIDDPDPEPDPDPYL
jgi:hypothetical protein